MARFTRLRPAPIVSGSSYQRFRNYVRTDFQLVCAYCLIPESYHPEGETSFELDHFKPQKRFEDEVDNFYNLYYCCHNCNKRKANKWPSAEDEEQGRYFVDLCESDFDTHYELQTDGTWIGLTEAAKYTIRMIRLNREGLVRFRLKKAEEGIEFR